MKTASTVNIRRRDNTAKCVLARVESLQYRANGGGITLSCIVYRHRDGERGR